MSKKQHRNLIAALFILLFIAFLTAPPNWVRSGKAQQTQAADDTRLSMLSTAQRERGRMLLNEQDANKRAALVTALGKKEPATVSEFLLALLETDPAAVVRRAVINCIGGLPQPEVTQALRHCASADADADVALLALEKLRQQQMTALNRLLIQRLETARQKGDAASEKLLAQEHERWISLVNGTMLPSFLRTAPPTFSLKAADQSVRVLTLGDFGYGASDNRNAAGEPQRQVAAAMLRAQQTQAFDFALTLGDNFYPDGMLSPTDPRWRTLWQELYDPLGLKFYATFGNHDWNAEDSPAAEILYSQTSQSWRLPSPYYTFTAGPVQFFALDTNEVSAAQLLWLKEALAQSRAQWKLVYGHHPIYSGGVHADNPALIEKLLPVLKGKADVYLAGHDHDMQHLKPEGSLHFFVNGAGGAAIRPSPPGERTIFSLSSYGFATIEANAQKLEVKFFNTDLKPVYSYTLSKASNGL